MPKSAFPEAFHSGNSRMFNWLLTNKLREFACALRQAHYKGQSMDSIRAAKEKMLEEVYSIVSVVLGEPPAKFDWNFRDKDKIFRTFTELDPFKFYREVVDFPLAGTVSLINDPRNEYYRLYTVEYLGNVVGGRPVLYINVPIEDLKKYAIKSIKDNHPGKLICQLYLYLIFSMVWLWCLQVLPSPIRSAGY